MMLTTLTTLNILTTLNTLITLATLTACQVLAYWPLLTVRTRAASSAKGATRCGTAHAFDLLWVERWGVSRHSAVLHAQQDGTALPSVRSLLTAIRKKIEGNGILENLAQTS